MRVLVKAAALSAGLVAALGAAGLAQQAAQPQPAAANETLHVAGQIIWLDESDVSARRPEGVIEQIELKVGMKVRTGDEIGHLYRKSAELAVTKASVIAESDANIKMAQAKKKVAIAEAARLERLAQRGTGYVSQSDLDKAYAEVEVADAQVLEAQHQQNVARAELAIAQQTLEEHTIVAPFDGVIVEKLKSVGDAVRGNEPIVKIGRTDLLKFVGWAPLEAAYRITPGDLVEVRVAIHNADLPVEKKAFKGKILSISKEVTGESISHPNEARVFAEVENPEDAPDSLQLHQGMRAGMTVYLNTSGAETGPAPAAAVGQTTPRR